MQRYRHTTAVVDLDAISANVSTILDAYPGYDYYVGVIKANCYGLGMERVAPILVEAGCNYLSVSQPEEALAARHLLPEVPIMVFVPCPTDSLDVLAENRIAVTVATLDQAEIVSQYAGLKVFIRVNGGQDLFGGPTTKKGFEEVFDQILLSPATLEGIYMHNYCPEDETLTLCEYARFEEMTAGVDLTQIPVVSTSNSLTLPRFERKPYSNACRIGNIIYGIENESLDLRTCFQLTSEITQILRLGPGETIGYGRAHVAEAEELIGVVPIGYGDGFAKANAGRDVFINDRRYRIATVTMDITLVVIDSEVGRGDEVVLVRDARHLDEIAAHTHGVAEEPICLLNQRIPREYIDS